MDAHTFDKLLKRVANLDESALEEIFQEYHKTILWIAFNITKSYVSADDVLSLVLIDVWNNASKYHNINNPDNWIFQVAKNNAFDFYRKFIKRQFQQVDIDSILDEDAFRYLQAHGCYSEIEFDSIISCLNDKEREIVKRKVLYESTHEEISKELNLPLGTVTWRYSNALKKLKIELVEKNSS